MFSFAFTSLFLIRLLATGKVASFISSSKFCITLSAAVSGLRLSVTLRSSSCQNSFLMSPPTNFLLFLRNLMTLGVTTGSSAPDCPDSTMNHTKGLGYINVMVALPLLSNQEPYFIISCLCNSPYILLINIQVCCKRISRLKRSSVSSSYISIPP